MSDSVHTTARKLLLRAVQATQAEGLLAKTPDYATNAALSLAKAAGPSPLVLGETIAKHLRLAEVTVAQQRQRVGDWHKTWDGQPTAARPAWVDVVRQVLETALSLLGGAAPQELKRAETA
jgi:arginyl-tRNA synthetase